MTATREPTLSTHVLDTERGVPAAGVPISLSRWDGDVLVPLATKEPDGAGRIREFAAALDPGTYQIRFDAAAYFARQGRDAPFLQSVVVEFRIADDGGHYHVPLLMSPYSCVSYRGS